MNAARNPGAEFLFDFGSPNAYLCHKVIPDIEARTGARFEYVPILLGGLFKLANNQSPGQAFAAIPKKLAYERLELQRFVTRHGLASRRVRLADFLCSRPDVLRQGTPARGRGRDRKLWMKARPAWTTGSV